MLLVHRHAKGACSHPKQVPTQLALQEYGVPEQRLKGRSTQDRAVIGYWKTYGPLSQVGGSKQPTAPVTLPEIACSVTRTEPGRYSRSS